MHSFVRRTGFIAFAGLGLCDGAPAIAAEGLEVSGYVNVDLAVVTVGGFSNRVRELDKAAITYEADFEKLAGWTGATGLLSLLHASGAKPGAEAGSLQGINNIEVSRSSVRVEDAWIQQALGERASIKAGVIDLNAEFYANDSTGLLLNPESGIGSEFAATGPGGPSVYPQTSLGLRLAYQPTRDTYLQAAVFNARVGNQGDGVSIDTSFDDGVIEVAEGGWSTESHTKLGFGVWRYSRAQDDLFDVDTSGNPIQRTSSGGYMVAEQVLRDGGETGRTVTGFLRAGFSNGNTGPLKSSWNTGLLIERAVASRPDSQFSIAFDQATLGDAYRAASAAGGLPLGARETHFEMTYSDQLAEHLAIQPDLQVIIAPGGDQAAKNAVIGTVRLTASF